MGVMLHTLCTTSRSYGSVAKGSGAWQRCQSCCRKVQLQASVGPSGVTLGLFGCRLGDLVSVVPIIYAWNHLPSMTGPLPSLQDYQNCRASQVSRQLLEEEEQAAARAAAKKAKKQKQRARKQEGKAQQDAQQQQEQEEEARPDSQQQQAGNACAYSPEPQLAADCGESPNCTRAVS